MLTQSQVQDSRRVGRQVPDPDKDPDLTHKTHHQKERRVSHQKKKDRQNQSTTTSTQTQTTCMREESHPKETKRKKKNHTTHSRLTSQHHPATPADTDPHPIIRQLLHHPLPCLHISCYHPFLHPTRILPTRLPTLSYTPTSTLLPFPATYRLLPLYHHPCLHYCSQLYPCLSRSRYRSPSTLLFRSLTVATSPLAWLPLFTCTTTIRLLSTYCSHVCLHYCARLLQHHAYRLGFSHCAHHSPSSSPSVCHPGCLRYHQSLTRVHSHSLPVPPPLPLADARSQGGSTVGRSRSLAPVPGVRLFFMVPLAGESPLADARLPPHPNGHLLFATARPYTPIHAYTVFASTPLVRIHAHILSSTPADILAVSSVHTMLTVLHPVLPA